MAMGPYSQLRKILGKKKQCFTAPYCNRVEYNVSTLNLFSMWAWLYFCFMLNISYTQNDSFRGCSCILRTQWGKARVGQIITLDHEVKKILKNDKVPENNLK